MLDFILQPLVEFIIFLVSRLSYSGILITMALQSACIPLPSEIIMPFSGFLVSQGIFSFWPTVIAGTAGSLFGSAAAYLVGAYGGEELVRKLIKKYGKYLLVFEYELDEAKEWFKKYGEAIAFGSRLLPVIRTFISLPAGIAKMDFKRFSFYTLAGSFIWTAVLTWLGVKLGENWDKLGSYFHKFDLLMIFLGILAAAWYVHHKLKKHRRRNS